MIKLLWLVLWRAMLARIGPRGYAFLQRISINQICQTLNDYTTRDIVLVIAVIAMFAWIAIGSLTKIDPYPFQFISTVVNMLGFIVMLVVANAQRGQHVSDLHEKIDALHTKHDDLHTKIAADRDVKITIG